MGLCVVFYYEANWTAASYCECANISIQWPHDYCLEAAKRNQFVSDHNIYDVIMTK